jgi:hypothetical protein
MNPISRVQNKTSKSPKSNAITPKPCLRPRVPQMASQLRSPHRSPPLPTRIPRRPQPIWMLLNKLNLLRHIPLTLLATWSAVLRHLNPITPDAEMPLPDHRPPVRSKTWWRSVVRTVAHAVATGESIHAAIGWRCSVVTPRIGVDDSLLSLCMAGPALVLGVWAVLVTIETRTPCSKSHMLLRYLPRNRRKISDITHLIA